MSVLERMERIFGWGRTAKKLPSINDLNGPYIIGDATYRTISHLRYKGIADKRQWENAALAWNACEAGRQLYVPIIARITGIYDEVTRGKSVDEIDAAIREGVEKGVYETRDYALDFLEAMRAANYRIAMLTSTPEEIARILNTEVFGGRFDDIMCTAHKAENGVYVGLEGKLTTSEAKHAMFEKYQAEHPELDWSRGLGVGDRITDVRGFMTGCRRKVLFHPDQEAYEAAKAFEREELPRSGSRTSWFIHPDPAHLGRALIRGLTEFFEGDVPEPADAGGA